MSFTFPGSPTLQIGGMLFADTGPNLIKLVAYANATNTYGGFRLQTDTAGTAYQVPSGKTLRISAIAVESLNSATGSAVRGPILGYGTASVGWSAGSAPSGAVYQGNQTAQGLLGTLGGGTLDYPSNSTRFELAIDFTIPQNDFPFFFSAGSGSADYTCYAYGYLE